MTFSDHQTSEKRGIDWLAIVRIMLAQVAVLFALAAAVVGYVNWSSELAWKEFSGRPEASAPVQRSQSSFPVPRARGATLPVRRA